MRSYVERETKWDVDPAAPVALGEGHEADSVTTDTVELTNTYYDTADLDLLSHNVTVRWREGSADERGWQVKIPTGADRTELSVTGAPDAVPEEITDLLWGLRLGKDLTVAAILHTRRTRHRYLDDQGRLRFEVADDTVSATIPGPVATATTWREIEVELGPQADAVPTRILKRLTGAGATRSTAPSKVARALGRDTPPPTSTASAAARAFEDYLTEQLDTIVAGDLALRRGEDQIHATRVAIRRLRSTLRTSADLFDAHQIVGVDEELKWFAGLLGEVRDRQVLRARFATAVAELPDDITLGPVAARIEQELLAEQSEHRARAADAMTSGRYLALLAQLSQWKHTLPTADSTITDKGLRHIVRRAARKADTRLATALATGDSDDLHRARKAAKRARYAAELGKPVVRKKHGTPHIKRYKKIQTVLGEHQDAAVAALSLRQLGARAGVRDGENGFTYGVLYQRELDAAQAARHHVSTLKA